MRKSTVLGAAILGALGAMVLSGPALADDPLTLSDGAYLADAAGVLTEDEASELDQRLSTLASDDGIDLWVVYVENFENPSDAQAWANESFNTSGLGPQQYVLAITTEGRELYLAADIDDPITDDQLVDIENAASTAISSGSWIDGGLVAADELGTTSSSGAGGAAPAGGGVPGGTTTIVLGVIAVAAVGAGVFALARRKRGDTKQSSGTKRASEPEIPIEQLQRDAAAALIATDDDVRSSEQELDFALAQFGAESVAPFRTAITEAKSLLSRAFELKQKLDDETEESPEQTRARNMEIIQLTDQASDDLEAQAAAFDELRQLEQNAPAALEQIRAMRVAANEYGAEARTALQKLTSTYTAPLVASVLDNPEQITTRLSFADDQIEKAQTALDGSDNSAAALGITQAEQAIGQARKLDTSIDELAASLGEVERQAAAVVADLEADIAQARASTGTTGQLAGVAARAEQQLVAAKQQLAATPRDPLAVLATLQETNALIDGELAHLRDAAERQRKATSQLSAAIAQAGAEINAAEDYVSARRGAVNETARTRLASAHASLAKAQQLASSDAAAALSAANLAAQYARSARESAAADVSMWGAPQQSSGGGSSFTGGLVGGIVGGLIGNSGSRRSSGWGGGGISLGGGGARSRSGGRSFGGGARSRGGGGARSRGGRRRF